MYISLTVMKNSSVVKQDKLEETFSEGNTLI